MGYEPSCGHCDKQLLQSPPIESMGTVTGMGTQATVTSWTG
jgi:hypothetical protein